MPHRAKPRDQSPPAPRSSVRFNGDTVQAESVEKIHSAEYITYDQKVQQAASARELALASALNASSLSNVSRVMNCSRAHAAPVIRVNSSNIDNHRIIPDTALSSAKDRGSDNGSLSRSRATMPAQDASGNVAKADESTEPNPNKKKPAKKCRGKKPKDMPKRPLSAYNIFFREERGKILDAIPSPPGYPSDEGDPDSDSEDEGDEKSDSDDPQRRRRGSQRPKQSKKSSSEKRRLPHGKIDFENLAKIIGKRWKELPSDRLEHYKAIAEEEMQRYKREMEEYNRRQAKLSAAEEMELERKKKEDEIKIKQLELEKLRERECEVPRKRSFEAMMYEESGVNNEDDVSPSLLNTRQRSSPMETSSTAFPRSYLNRARRDIEKQPDDIVSGDASMQTAVSVPSNDFRQIGNEQHLQLAASLPSLYVHELVMNPQSHMLEGYGQAAAAHRNEMLVPARNILHPGPIYVSFPNARVVTNAHLNVGNPDLNQLYYLGFP